jgi:pyruvate dehydrogenase E2 component (dihydrolipoamide acetyltransferase)
VMPRLSDSMEEGTIVQWLAASGDAVSAGDAIVEIETDKATMEYEAEDGGVLEILAAEGATVALGAAIARLLPEGSEGSEVSQVSEIPPPSAAAPVPDTPSPAPSRPPAKPGRILATPVARRMAAEHGFDLSEITATGRRGQIVKADVQAHSQNGDAPADGAAPAVPAAPAASSAAHREQLTRVQRTIARRMAESRALVPDFEVSVDIDMAACLDLRAQLKEHLDPVPSINDMIVRACALALREHPRVNAAYRDEGFDLFEQINVGVAVASQDALLVAVVPDTDRTPLSEIAVATRRLAERARSGEITPPELSGATFTVSNLGMFGVDRFTAIINQPQAAILAVGAVADRPVVRDGAVVAGKVMTATLASDHRILYGADAARFVTDVRDRLQAPLRLLA